MKLTDNQIKQIEELTGHKYDGKFIGHVFKRQGYFLEIDESEISYFHSHLDYIGSIPVKWLRPLADILEIKKEEN